MDKRPHLQPPPCLEPDLWFCACGQGMPHTRLITPQGRTPFFEKKSVAKRMLESITQAGDINAVQTKAIEEKIDQSTLTDPVPDGFYICRNVECWLRKLPHGHLTINDSEYIAPRCSIQGATSLLVFVAQTLDLSVDQVTQIQASIQSSGLPTDSSADIVLNAIEEARYEEMQQATRAIVQNSVQTAPPAEGWVEIEGQRVHLAPGGSTKN